MIHLIKNNILENRLLGLTKYWKKNEATVGIFRAFKCRIKIFKSLNNQVVKSPRPSI